MKINENTKYEIPIFFFIISEHKKKIGGYIHHVNVSSLA